METDSYYGFTQGWSVALPCEEQCDVHTDLAMDSVKGILEAAATEAYTFLCQGMYMLYTLPFVLERLVTDRVLTLTMDEDTHEQAVAFPHLLESEF